MEKKKPIKISLTTFCIIFVAVVSMVIGYFVYALSVKRDVTSSKAAKIETIQNL